MCTCTRVLVELVYDALSTCCQGSDVVDVARVDVLVRCSDAVTSVSHGGVLANEFFAAYHDVCGMLSLELLCPC